MILKLLKKYQEYYLKLNINMSDYLLSTLKISITEFLEKYINGKIITFYKIEVYDNYSKETWILEKRFSEINTLHKTLSKLYPNIPPMPGMTLFKIRDHAKLEKRKQQLEVFLRECSNRKDILSNESFKEFIEIDKKTQNISNNQNLQLNQNIINISKNQNDDLKNEIDRLRKENNILKKEINSLKNENKELNDEIQNLNNTIASYNKINLESEKKMM